MRTYKWELRHSYGFEGEKWTVDIYYPGGGSNRKVFAKKRDAKKWIKNVEKTLTRHPEPLIVETGEFKA